MNLSFLSAIYIIYMFNYFQTDIYLSHPFDIYTSNVSFLNHGQKSNHICHLGNMIGYLLAFWFIVRHFLSFSKKTLQKINILILNTTLIGSLLTNMNAFVYFLPLYIIQNYSSSLSTIRYVLSSGDLS
jgi:hypothetical protein